MIWIILIIGLILRLVSLNQSLWLDEAINILAAQKFSFLGMVTQYAIGDFHPPGWFMVLWVWGKIFGYSEIVLRMPSVIFGVLAVFVVYLIGKKIISREVGLVAAMLLAVNPLHIYYSQDARMYSLATLAVAINVFLLAKILKGEKVNLIFLVLSNLAVLMSDYVSYFIFPAQLIFLILKRKELLTRWFLALAGALILGSWWLPTFLAQLDTGAVVSANLPTWKFVVGGFDVKALPLTFVKFIIGRINLTDKMIYAAVLLPVSSLFTFLLWRSANKVNNLSRNLLLTWVVIPPVMASAVSLIIPIYSYFRVLFVVPGFVLLIAAGILSFKNKLRYTFLTIVVLIEVFCSLVYLLNPAFQREDWRGLVNYLGNQRNSQILFESSGTLPPFDYYAEGNLDAKGALKDFPVKDEAGVVDLADLLKDGREVYLVNYLVEISDPNRLVAKELTSLGYQETDIKNFYGVGFVYHYVRKN